MIKYLFSIFIVSFLLMMCSKNNSDVVSMEKFQSEILIENTFVLDVRTEAEFYGPLGHIDGAMLIPIDELSLRINELEDMKDKDIYVVCRSGNRSNVGKNILRENSLTLSMLMVECWLGSHLIMNNKEELITKYKKSFITIMIMLLILLIPFFFYAN